MLRSIGFIPVIEGLVSEMGNLHPAYIYGYMWLNKDLDSHFTEALENLPDRLGISRTTIKKHVKWLCETGYLEDLTPDLINEAHTYLLTNKVEVAVSVQVGIWPTKSNGRPVASRPVLPVASRPVHERSHLDRHDHVMMHDHESTDLTGINELWHLLGFDKRGLPKMLKTWETDLESLQTLLQIWWDADEAGELPEDWGHGLLYKKIMSGEVPPDRPVTIGDEVRAMMEIQNAGQQIYQGEDHENG